MFMNFNGKKFFLPCLCIVNLIKKFLMKKNNDEDYYHNKTLS
jgi:hypothetical protein